MPTQGPDNGWSWTIETLKRRRVAITGITGQLGRALVDVGSDRWEISGHGSTDLDVRDWRAVRDWIVDFDPDVVIHAAANTDVDACERDPIEAYRSNALGTRHVAQAAAMVNAELVAISTNFVFDGDAGEPYHEFDLPNPINVYGASKLAGEREALNTWPRTYIVRTAMVYAAEGRNFVNTMRQLMQERDQLSVVSDQRGNPTYAPDLARGILQLLESGAPYGIVHMTNSGEASWYEWAVEIATCMDYDIDILSIDATEFPRDATPPANGAMTSLVLPELQIELPTWQDALGRCLSA